MNRIHHSWLKTAATSIYLCSLATACTNAAIPGNIEEARLPLALAALPLRLSKTEEQAANNNQALERAPNVKAAEAIGNLVWQKSVKQTQQGLIDDRPLYWQRLATKRLFREDCLRSNCNAKLKAFELSSRGIQDLNFKESETLNVLITGFDPFALDQQVTQTNPSGVLALQLDNQLLTNQSAGQSAQLQSVIFPVRFADFDQGLVEQILTPLLESAAVDVVITLSMGRERFDLERFPGKRRATRATDNLNQQTGASATNPRLPMLDGQPIRGPEFVEFSLPVAALVKEQSPYPVVDNRRVRTLEDGELTATSIRTLANKTAVAGSGGTYLSNEVSYRSIALSERLNLKLPMGHIHLPRLTGYDEATLRRISRQLHAMLRHAIPDLIKATKR